MVVLIFQFYGKNFLSHTQPLIRFQTLDMIIENAMFAAVRVLSRAAFPSEEESQLSLQFCLEMQQNLPQEVYSLLLYCI